jgi:AcrR family transcriptional regulator
MARLNEEQLEQIRNDRKDQIMAAALKVFADNGIRLTKISMIATEAGISHGLLYHYFKSKEEVLHKSLEWAMTGTSELLQEMGAMQATPLQILKHFIKTAFTDGNSDVFRVVQHVFRSPHHVPESTKELVEHTGAMYITALYPLIVQGQAQGELIQSDPQEMIELFLNVISGLMTEYDKEWWSNNTDHKLDLLLRMITTR